MKGYTRSIVFLFVCAMSVFSRSEDTLSTQEIFRPMILPRGMWQLYYRNFNFDFSGDYNNIHGWFTLTTFLPAHSFSDRFMMSSFPLPYFFFRISKYDILDENKKWTKKPSVILGFGIPSVYNLTRNGSVVVPVNFRIHLKKLLSEKHFYYCGLSFGVGVAGSFRLISYGGGIWNGLGIQLAERTCLDIAYGFAADEQSNYPYSFKAGTLFLRHKVPIRIIVNVNKHISVNIGSGINMTHNITDDELYVI